MYLNTVREWGKTSWKQQMLTLFTDVNNRLKNSPGLCDEELTVKGQIE